jgi:hypothetical protein
MMSYFPAAHSMDTTWFAIDADGYVGVFDSGEGGAVPDELTSVDRSRCEIESIDDVISALQADNHELIQEISSWLSARLLKGQAWRVYDTTLLIIAIAA